MRYCGRLISPQTFGTHYLVNRNRTLEDAGCSVGLPFSVCAEALGPIAISYGTFLFRRETLNGLRNIFCV